MSKEYKPTEFSVHLSRSKMRKYLNDSLTPREEKEVELHLKHCAHCSNVIVEYVENGEPEQYKVHMAKLKGKLMSSVKPRKRKFTTGRIKVIRAAAAVAALCVFSFFALGSMAKKDFNLVSDAGKKGNALPELKANPKKVQKPKASTSLLSEKKTDEDSKQVAVNQKLDKEVEKKETPSTPVAKKQPQTNASQTKVKEEKPKVVTAPEKDIEKTTDVASQTLADAAVEKKEVTNKKEVEKEKASEAEPTEVEEEKAEVEKIIKPLQKLEKIDAGTQTEVMPEAQNLQTIPNKDVGQLRQR